jgi:hypothetical protein
MVVFLDIWRIWIVVIRKLWNLSNDALWEKLSEIEERINKSLKE